MLCVCAGIEEHKEKRTRNPHLNNATSGCSAVASGVVRKGPGVRSFTSPFPYQRAPSAPHCAPHTYTTRSIRSSIFPPSHHAEKRMCARVHRVTIVEQGEREEEGDMHT